MTDEIKIKFTIDAAQALEAAAKQRDEVAKLEKAWNEAGDAAKKAAIEATRSSVWKTLNTDVNKLGEAFEKSNPKMAGFAASAQRVFKGVAMGVGAFAAVGAAAIAFGAQLEQHQQTVNRLGDAYAHVTVATNGAISAQQALTLRGQIQAAGVQVNAQQLGTLTRAVREYALATGNDANEAVEKLTNAIVNNSEDALSELGLAQARASSSTQTLSNVVRELENRYRGVAPAARTFNEDLAKVPDALMALGGEAMRNALSGLEQLGNRLSSTGRGATSFFRAAAAGWRELIEAGDTLRNRDQQQRSTENMEQRRQQRERTSAAFREGRVQLSEVNTANFGDLSDLTVQERGRVNRAANPLFAVGASISESVNRELSAIADERLQRQAAEGQRELQRARNAADVERKVRKLGDSAESTANQLTNVQRAAAMGLRRRGGVTALGAEEFSDLLGRLAAPGDDELNAEAASRTKAEAAFAEERAGVDRDRARQQRRFERDRQTRVQSVSQGRSVGAGIQRGLGVSADVLETEAKLTQGYADSIVGAFDKIGSAITRHVELVASGQETIGQAVLAGTHEVTKAIAMEALPRSLMELAAGFAALANPVTAPTAPLHFTAAAVYGGVAAGAGLVAGVTGALGGAGAPAAAAGATGAARAASGATPPPREEAAAPVSIYLNSTVPPGPRELQTLVAATRQSNRYQLDSRAQMVPRSVRA